MNDSLTSYLVILGGVVLIGMLAHGAWTARKAAARHPKRAEVEPVDGDSQHDAFSAGVQFARTQGIVPAPESTHAIAACARHVANSDKEEVVVIGLSGHGQLDLPAYAEFLDGKF